MFAIGHSLPCHAAHFVKRVMAMRPHIRVSQIIRSSSRLAWRVTRVMYGTRCYMQYSALHTRVATLRNSIRRNTFGVCVRALSTVIKDVSMQGRRLPYRPLMHQFLPYPRYRLVSKYVRKFHGLALIALSRSYFARRILPTIRSGWRSNLLLEHRPLRPTGSAFE
jgi:hypothetical protein